MPWPKRYLTLHDETLHLAAWAARAGLSVPTLASRLRRGLSLEEALAPVGTYHKIALAVETSSARQQEETRC